MQISKETERRFVLGLQGLWPGRRWSGVQGVRDALLQCRRIQVDPLDIVGRNHDLVLASRVEGYRPVDLERVLYEERTAFEHGGNLNIYPRERLALQWSWVYHEGLPVRWEEWGRAHSATVRRVRGRIDRGGPTGAGDWAGGEPVEDYRSRRLEGLALHYMWRRFDIMIHHREGNRKFYDRTERLFGRLPTPISREETRADLALETLGWLGLSGHDGTQFLRIQEEGRGRSRLSKRQLRDGLTASGRLTEVLVEGHHDSSVLRTEDLPFLETVAQGEIPRSWQPLTTEPETTFLAPLDITSAHGRSEMLFGFENPFEVYKPPSQRRWGYYVLPVLLGDRLVGRIEPVRNKIAHSLRVSRAWWEKGVRPDEIVKPFSRGLDRFARYLEAPNVILGEIGSSRFRDAVARELRQLANGC